MALEAAIFDCDGTLVDSSWMWIELTHELLREGGIAEADIARVFDEIEPLPLYEMCQELHRSYGFAKTGDEIYADYKAKVAYHYCNSVTAKPGIKRFLKRLHELGVPLACASSTSPELLRLALGAQGIMHYIDHIVSTGAGMPDKTRPDIWLHCMELLGSEPEATWVFEDGPFSFRSAHAAGAQVVGFYKEGEGRDLADHKANCEFVIHSYDELSPEALIDFEPAPAARAGTLNVLLVLGSPEGAAPLLLQQEAALSDYLIAVDRGLVALDKAGLVPNLFVGDADSVDAALLSRLQPKISRVIKSAAYKYETDFKMALRSAENEANRQKKELALTLAAASGGRPDHALGVIGNALAAGHPCRIVEDGFEARILEKNYAPSWEIGPGHAGCTFSTMALSEDCVVSLSGFEWDIEKTAFSLLGEDSLSNIVRSDAAQVSLHAGACICWCFRAQDHLSCSV